MRTFRGVEEQAVIRSIEEGAKFLLAENVGPLCNAAMTALLSSEGLAKMKAAPTNEAFIEALVLMPELGALSDFKRALQYHARANTNGQGQDIYLNLSSWGAFRGIRQDNVTPEDQEIMDYLDSKPKVDWQAPIPGNTDTPFHYYYLTAPGIDLPQEPERPEIKTREDRMAHIEKRKAYKAALEEAYSPVSDRLKPLLTHYSKRYEASDSIGIGSIGAFQEGIELYMIAEAAQKIADTLTDCRLVDRNGKAVSPSQGAGKSHTEALESRRASERAAAGAER